MVIDPEGEVEQPANLPISTQLSPVVRTPPASSPTQVWYCPVVTSWQALRPIAVF